MKKPGSGTINAAVLGDRMRLALALPERVSSWHWLYHGLATATEPMRQPVLAALRRKRPTSALGALHAATLLDSFALDLSELARGANAVVDGALPLDAGQALLGTALARCLRECTSGEALMDGFRASGSLRVSAYIGEALDAEARRVAAAAAAGSTAPAPPAAGRASSARRVAVVAPSLSTGYHAPTTMALAHACALVDAGNEVEVYAPQESLMPHMDDWLGTPREMSLSELDTRLWPVPASGSYRLRLPNRALSMHRRWTTVLGAVQSFAPHAVLFVGAMSPLLWPLQRRWPTVGLGTNAVPPLGPLDLWLAPDDLARTWGVPLGTPMQRVHTQRLYMQTSVGRFDTDSLPAPTDAVLWLTSSSRATGELRADWCAQVVAALQRHPSAHWVIVRAGAALPAHLDTHHPRIHVLGFQSDLGALMRACSVYLNPPRVGGGQTVAMAMAHGLPVVALNGGDGGDKVGDAGCANLPGCFELLDRWTRDPRERTAAAEAQRQRFETRFDVRGCAPALASALDAAIEARTAIC
jgi:hypothetical protein